MKKNTVAYSFLLATLFLGGCAAQQSSQLSLTNRVRVGDREVDVQVAHSAADQERGLGGVPSLSWDEGMLFVFSEAESHTFWMQGMLMPIDIIWISGDRVVGIEKSVPPPEAGAEGQDLALYPSPQPVDRALEVRSGFAKRYGVQTGDVFAEEW
ncbi:MAG: hypothetical protein A3B31_03215 [Candidatus Komeilibacteria bacterium RIFCSPLOWO2_01_FULL_53_11]|uniref:DUF192 domain-containing protein n=1 Tax=Candidatus Komeilibacteria bacterium RIFCSPLOWO2_01_FULL_53_11 TaxID=1798552 RepID=A0A1G2BUC9_9BACT|nr:MAG: hypothetical protein A3B31_03215 [Candidatus Komeilibacteria bacterium RIFCSPLOWO2_01_FULL_53_11]